MTLQSHSWAYTWRKLIRKDTCTPSFIAALFTTAKTWEELKCPLTLMDKEDVLYTHTNTQWNITQTQK